MKIANSFAIEAPIATVWDVLTDMSVIASCIPGAVIHAEDAGLHQGSVKFKLGPVIAEYRGSAEFVERDQASYRAVIDSTASDTRGTGDARAMVTIAMTDHGSCTVVEVRSDLDFRGKVAQFGRGVVQDASDRLFLQFAACAATQFSDITMLEAVAVENGTKAASSRQTTAGMASPSDGETLDLVHVAGRAVAKRVVPVALAGLTVAVVVLLMLI